MCQQTHVKTVLPFYEQWIAAFPDVMSLAKADIGQLLDLWQGLGYYRRAHNLAAVARSIANGGWPGSYQEWLSQPGVGPYTAAALSSILLNESQAVVDGNVARVFARVTSSDLTGTRLLSAAFKWANELIGDAPIPGDFNQAMMEIGATICNPRTPSCIDCPFGSVCISKQFSSQTDYPKRTTRAAVKEREMHALICVRQGKIALTQSQSDWWQGLWTLPIVAKAPLRAERLGKLTHTVTNHRIALHLYSQRSTDPGAKWFALDQLPAMPAPHRRALRLYLGAADVL